MSSKKKKRKEFPGFGCGETERNKLKSTEATDKFYEMPQNWLKPSFNIFYQ